ncbi:MAG: single-stranded DNA-binding protein [Bacteroidales bacterium]|nr:single-stranded DNA-binding protein [Bacteroidales bacterium]
MSDNRVYRFTLATSRAYKDKNGTAVIETTWHQVVAWENDNMPDLSQIEKGSKLYVSGRIRNQKYLNSEDVEKQVVEVVANRVVFVESQEPLAYEM